jgi:uncharacterized membrane protein YhaH (DUF805 family)
MDWGHLLFKFSGRTNRAKFWLAALVYFAINVVLAVIGYATDQSAAFQAVNGMIGIVIFISGLAVGVKRLHDRNKSGWYLLVFYVVPGILMLAAIGAYFAMEDGGTVAAGLGFAAFAIGVWAFVELACLRGTVGPNAYGPDPLVPAAVRAPA